MALNDGFTTDDMCLTLGVLRGELRKLFDGRTYIGESKMRPEENLPGFFPDSFAVLAGARHTGPDSPIQTLSTFSVIAKPVTVVQHDGKTAYELMFASFQDAQSGCISLGLERAVSYLDVDTYDYDHFNAIIDVRTTLNKTSEHALTDMSLQPVGRQISSSNKGPFFLGFISPPTMGGECRSLHISYVGEGEYDIKHSEKQHRYIPNAWVSANRLLEDPNTFEKLCPWSVQFVEALRAEQSCWTPEREQGLKTIC